MKIGFIGFGNMAHAIATGIIEQNLVSENDITAFDVSSEQITNYKHKVLLSDTALQTAAGSDYLFFCVKPQTLEEAASSLYGKIKSETVIISIMAGVTSSRLKTLLNTERPIVRVMPNTPLMIGKGCTAVARPDGITDRDFDFVFSVFNCIGYAFELPESKINEIIPVNSSSPAAVYYFAKTVAENAENNGIPFDTALKAFCHTLIGSAEMMLRTDKSVDELINMVCSKGGTTLAMLDAFKANGFDSAVNSGLDSCLKRAYELGK